MRLSVWPNCILAKEPADYCTLGYPGMYPQYYLYYLFTRYPGFFTFYRVPGSSRERAVTVSIGGIHGLTILLEESSYRVGGERPQQPRAKNCFFIKHDTFNYRPTFFVLFKKYSTRVPYPG